MRLAPFALFTGLLPLLCVHLSYVIAAAYGHVDWCVPYWDSCSSISATGRELPEKLVFKLLMLPASLCAIAFWYLVSQWLRVSYGRASHVGFSLGALAALFLMLYVVALGESNAYRWARQTGIILFFTLTYVAQLCFLARLAAVPRHDATVARVFRWQCGAALLLLAIGLLSLALDALWPAYDSVEDAFEWLMMLCIALQFCSHYPLWKAADLRLSVMSR